MSSDPPTVTELLLQVLERLGRIEEQLEKRGFQTAPSREGRSLEDLLNELIDGMGRIERAISNMPRPSAGQAVPAVDPQIAGVHDSLRRVAEMKRQRDEELERLMSQPGYKPSQGPKTLPETQARHLIPAVVM